MKSSKNSIYKDAARANLKGQLLDVASRILATEGTEALGIRRITEEVGASTMVFYSTFGSKQGLMEALWQEGFERVWNLQQQVLQLNLEPVTRLIELLKVYRTNAQTNPEYYGITFGGTIKADSIPEEVRQKSRRVLNVLVEAVAAGIESKQIIPGDPLEIATSLWASAHGYCSIELSNFLTDRTSDEVFARHIESNLKAYLTK